VTFVTFPRSFDILDFAKETKKNTYRVTKTLKNVTLFQIFGTKGTFTFYVWIRLGTALTLSLLDIQKDKCTHLHT